VKPVLSREQMRAFDAYAIRTCRVPSLVLMENAGRNAADVIERSVKRKSGVYAPVIVVCGTGNNGGDGFVIARHLFLRGHETRVFLIGAHEKLSPDARANADVWAGLGRATERFDPNDTEGVECFRIACDEADVVVDAIFGTGLDRPVDGAPAAAIGAMNRARARRVAVDVPSGLDANTGAELGVGVRADTTVTFAHLKAGLLTPSGARFAGKVEVVDIGVPSWLTLDETAPFAHVVERIDVARWAQPRAPDAHKHSVGHVGIFAGSPGKIGASLMVATGALRAGAGAATICTWQDAVRALQAHVVEVMTAELDHDVASVDQALAGKHSVVIGPGFGTGEVARGVVDHVLRTYGGPVVVDADAITLLSRGSTALRARPDGAPPPILTPHSGELARLLGRSSQDVESDRFAAAREAATRHASVVLLKGPHTLVVAPDGRILVNASGNPALATAGSGDVLAGICGALACALGPLEAAAAAAYIHGAAADAWSAEHDAADRGMLATEIAGGVPTVLADLVTTPA
jgi:ADP-dependent NAD(P)H-hydrate dehydratase / NAD(P)H-hydrate epimerase